MPTYSNKFASSTNLVSKCLGARRPINILRHLIQLRQSCTTKKGTLTEVPIYTQFSKTQKTLHFLYLLREKKSEKKFGVQTV